MPATLTDSEINEFRSRLCAEAERQFAEHGVEAVSMRSLAKALGCSATTPYRYFRNKEEILAAVRASILHRVCDMLESAGHDQPNGTSWAQAHTAAFLGFAFDEPNAYRLLYDLYQPEGSKVPELVGAIARSMHVMTGYVERLIEEGQVQGDAATLGFQYFAAVHGLIGLWMTGLFKTSRKDLEASCRDLLRLITAGARAQRPDAQEKPRAPRAKARRTAATPRPEAIPKTPPAKAGRAVSAAPAPAISAPRPRKQAKSAAD